MKEIAEGSAPARQITKMGVVNIASANFSIADGHFLLKNDNADAVTLDVKLYNDNSDAWITTVFSPGWNPEVLKEVKAQAGVSNLKWGK